jgi:hypothetical protein
VVVRSLDNVNCVDLKKAEMVDEFEGRFLAFTKLCAF